MFWLGFILLPDFAGPTYLAMDLFKSHSTQNIKDWLRAHRIIPSLVPGCTGLVQSLDVSVNPPFKDILKQTIDGAVDLAEKQSSPDSLATKGRQRKLWQSAASEMRPMMTQCVGATWEQFDREKK